MQEANEAIPLLEGSKIAHKHGHPFCIRSLRRYFHIIPFF
jgi:hypothetical protein